MTGASWLGQVRSRTVREVAQALGIDVDRDGLPCPEPTCQAATRGRADQRSAAGLRPDGRGWHCHVCGASGDAVTLVALATIGRVPAKGDRDGWRAIRSSLLARGIGSIDDDLNAARAASRSTTTAREQLRPPPNEVASVWASCGPVDRDEGVRQWLVDLGADPSVVAHLDLVRALPVEGSMPPWIAPWARRRRAVFPAWNASAELASLRFRAIGRVRGPKATGPSGKDDRRTHGQPYSIGGTALACPVARAILAGAAVLDEWDGTIVVVEGEPDFLTWTLRLHHAGERPAVLGIGSGWWSPALAERIPAGATVIVRTHHDEAGDKYALDVHRTLTRRCRTLRAHAPAEVSDAS